MLWIDQYRQASPLGVTPFLIYDTSTWAGGAANLENLGSAGSAWDLPVDTSGGNMNAGGGFTIPSTVWPTFTGLQVENMTLTMIAAYKGGLPSSSSVNLQITAAGTNRSTEIRMTVDLFGNVRADVARYKAFQDSGPPLFTTITNMNRARAWRVTSSIPTNGLIVVSVDPILGTWTSTLNGTNMPVLSTPSAIAAGDSTTFKNTGGNADTFTGNQIQIDTNYDTGVVGAGVQWQMPGIVWGTGLANAFDIAYWSTYFGV